MNGQLSFLQEFLSSTLVSEHNAYKASTMGFDQPGVRSSIASLLSLEAILHPPRSGVISVTVSRPGIRVSTERR